MNASPSIVALIPARAGSKRCPGKNTRLLGGKPLIQWTIDAAQASQIFRGIYICTDDWRNDAILAVADRLAGLIKRDPVPDDQPDVVWVSHALTQIVPADAFAILRPTSPFRTAAMIQRAWQQFQALSDWMDSLRAVQPVREHPGKMWRELSDRVLSDRLVPLLSDRHDDGTQWHSSPTQTLPPYYVQNGSLEMARTRVLKEYATISGDFVAPFFTEGDEGFDINTEQDWSDAETIAARLHPVLT